MRRRGWLRVAGAAAAAPLASLSGCGFALRSEAPLPFQRIALVGFANGSPLEAELRRRLANANAQVMPALAQAEVVLRVLEDRRQKVVAASTAAGQVRELTLRVRLRFSAETPAGRELIGETELQLSRDLSYSERDALAKEQEEGELYAAMQTDIVLQVLRRLSRVRVAG